MVVFNILKGLSFSKGVELLQEEGYVKGECVEMDDVSCDKLFLYPYVLNDNQGNRIECIYWAEYCNEVIDDEYEDGRMTWEDIKSNWQKEC